MIGSGVLLGLSIAAPIGPVNIEIIRRGLRSGFLPALLVGCGSTVADLFYVSVVYLGVAPLITQPAFRILLDLSAALVLGFLARTSFREALPGRVAPSPEGIEPHETSRGAFVSGLLITLSNPMTAVFYLSLFGGAVASLHDASAKIHLLFVGGVVVGCLLWCLFLALVLAWGRERAGGRWRVGVSLVSGLVLAFFAARFLFQAIQEIVSWAR